MQIALTIAGSDSGGGAGIQADLKTFQRFGVFGTSAITAITAQNTRGVTAWEAVSPDLVRAQIDALVEDLPPAAFKSGMLANASVASAVSSAIGDHSLRNYVLDPVMVATSGDVLFEPDTIDVIRSQLIPQAFLVTPNLHEAAILVGEEIEDEDGMARAAEKIVGDMGAQAVLIKGGHLLAERATDLLYDGRFFNVFKGEFIDTPHTHGTGCTYASAIAAQLARGKTITDAVAAAKTYVTEAIRHSLAIGHGAGPTNHFYFLPG